MLPYRDDNPTILTPYVTLGIVAANVLVWVLVQGMGAEPQFSGSVCRLALIPGEFLHQLPAGTEVPVPAGACVTERGNLVGPLTSMFLHGGWGHILGNLWFLWVFGNNVEDSMGHVRFLLFYLVCGLAAATAQLVADPNSAVPMLGASGAISGVMGAYIILYPTVRVHMITLLIFYPFRFTLPAFFMLGFWFLLQVLSGTAAPKGGGGVAFWAHVGGFVAGALLIPLFRDPELVARHRRSYQFV